MLKWNVYLKDMNRQEIKIFNVFDHISFKKEVMTFREKVESKEAFSEEVRHIAMYYFWSKCEYETVITSWPPYVDREEIQRLCAEYAEDRVYRTNVNLVAGKKIDVFDQLQLNWDAFIDYVWNFQEDVW